MGVRGFGVLLKLEMALVASAQMAPPPFVAIRGWGLFRSR